MINNVCTDTGYHSLNKYGEQLCGDHVEIIEGDDSLVMVLADGLGSGVKACILSTLTSKIISTMIANAISIEECISTIASTLPVCEKRGIAYSTFTIIKIVHNNEAEIIQFDNPSVILLRNGKSFHYDNTSFLVGEKTIYRAHVTLKLHDLLVAMSDGVVHAGVGRNLNYGWRRENIIAFLEKRYRSSHTATDVSQMLTAECNTLYGGMPGDDTTVVVVQIRKNFQSTWLLDPLPIHRMREK